MASQIDTGKVKKTITAALDKIQREADPHVLNEYRSLIKKEVSFFRRSYLTAYLLMLADQGGTGRAGSYSRDKRSSQPRYEKSGEKRPNESRRGEAKPYPLADEDSVRLFVSVGRSRRVFPREILGLINAKTAISKDDIGAIRILDNYSFVQVRNTVADTIIEALNGITFRGRTLTVNYARNRKDEDADGSSGLESPALTRSSPSANREDADLDLDLDNPEPDSYSDLGGQDGESDSLGDLDNQDTDLDDQDSHDLDDQDPDSQDDDKDEVPPETT